MITSIDFHRNGNHLKDWKCENSKVFVFHRWTYSWNFFCLEESSMPWVLESVWTSINLRNLFVYANLHLENLARNQFICKIIDFISSDSFAYSLEKDFVLNWTICIEFNWTSNHINIVTNETNAFRLGQQNECYERIQRTWFVAHLKINFTYYIINGMILAQSYHWRCICSSRTIFPVSFWMKRLWSGEVRSAQFEGVNLIY